MQIDYYQDNLAGVDIYEGVYEYGFVGQASPSMLGSWLISLISFLVGIFLLMFVNGSIGPAVFGVLFFAAGLLIHITPGLNNPYARRSFVLSFCLCILITGIAQSYAQMFFEKVHTTIDAETFYRNCRHGPITHYLGTELPVTIWQHLYAICNKMGFKEGPWLGILVNCLLVGLSGSVTVRTGRYVFGDDDIRLRRLGTLFALCGMFWLYGSIFVRDSFALFLNVLVLWGIVRGLALPSIKNLIIMIATLLFGFICMEYIRDGLKPMFVLFGLIALFSWTRRFRSDVVMLILPLVVILVGLMLFPLITSHLGFIEIAVVDRATQYGSGSVYEGSLGSTLVAGQPIPIRLLVGPFYVLISPIPFWNNFSFGHKEYHWLKGFHGIYLLWIMPMAVTGLVAFFKRAIKGGAEAPVACFIAFYAIITLLAIAATSLENRHHGQFLPAMLILAAVPDKHDPVTQGKLKFIIMGWFAFVLAGHLFWVVLKVF